MSRIKGLLCLLSVFSTVFICYGLPNTNAQKEELINKLVEKVSNLSLKTIANSSPENKSKILQIIEQKLKKSAKSLEPRKYNKYIKLLMKGLAVNTYKNADKEWNKKGTNKDVAKHDSENKPAVESSNIQDEEKAPHSEEHHNEDHNEEPHDDESHNEEATPEQPGGGTLEPKSNDHVEPKEGERRRRGSPNTNAQKKKLIEKIVKKISNLSSKTMANSAPEDKSRILKIIEEKLKKSAKSLGPRKYSKYIKLLTKGLAVNSYKNADKKRNKIGTMKDVTEHDTKNKPAVEDKEKVPPSEEQHNEDHNEEPHEDEPHNNEPQNDEPQNVEEPNEEAPPDEPGGGPQEPKTDQPVDGERRRRGENRVHITSSPKNIRRLNSNNSAEIENENATQIIMKDKLITSVADKIKILINSYIKSIGTEEAQQEAIEKIKDRFKQTAERRKQLLHGESDDNIKTYTDLISKGVQIFMHDPTPINNITRKMDINSDDIIVNKSFKKDTDKYLPSYDALINYHGSGNKDQNSMPFKLDYVKDSKLHISCDEDINETCSKIMLLNTFACANGKKVMHISKICDGNADCEDSSDEVNCARQALECVQNAARVLSHIDASVSHDCYKGLQDSGFLFKQNEVFRKLLEKQLEFIQLHTGEVPESFKRRFFNADALKNSVNAVTNVVNAFRIALDVTVCGKKNATQSQITPSKKRSEVTKIAPEVGGRGSLENCNCIDQNCVRPCSEICDGICEKKYSLSRFQCQAANGDRNIDIDLVCDGKLDCIDETDEDRCFEENSVTKYEATEMYNHILKLIMDKTSSTLYEMLRNDLVALHDLVTKLQKLTLAHYDINVSEVKRVRESCFKQITSIYSNALRFSTTPEVPLIVYIFMLTLNEKLISAMKRSHIGNDKIIATRECVCRGYECTSSRCSESCKRVCAAEPNLTRYFCSGSKIINNSVPIEHLCNGYNNCPGGDDEENCKKEVCRSHHLKILKHNIRNAGEKHKGTALGEALIAWRKKAIPTLEYNEVRPTRNKILEVLNVILGELVMTYGSIKDYRRDNSKAFEEFRMWSQVLMDGARSCI